MYLEYYGLAMEPFSMTPDPEFLYLSPYHKEALASLVYGVTQRKGFMLLIGEVGTGKTTVLRSFLSHMENENTKIYYIFNPRLNFFELLINLLDKEEVNKNEYSIDSLIEELQKKLISEYNAGHIAVLIIDDAQQMTQDTLEQLRLLSNLETTKDKLLQIILAGQPELDVILNSYDIRQLRQRIAIYAKLKALEIHDSQEYIQRRLQIASSDRLFRHEPIFTSKALEYLARYSNGYPRILNILCDNALIIGFGDQAPSISLKIAKEVIVHNKQHLDLSHPSQTISLFKKQYGIFIMICVFILGLLSVVFFLQGYKGQVPTLPLFLSTFFSQEKHQHFENPPPDVSLSSSNTSFPAVQAIELSPVARDFFLSKMISPPSPVILQGISMAQVIKKGDTLFEIMVTLYGKHPFPSLEQLKLYNPHLRDLNAIHPGDKVYFPVLNTTP